MKNYIFTEDNHRKLVCKLAVVHDGKEAYEYASQFPDEAVCKEIIIKYEAVKIDSISPKIKIDKKTWVEIYNSLFKIINVIEDTSTYFSGPRFINTLKNYEQFHPDYNQYIMLRKENGESTTRKIFYYDIIMQLDVNTRINFINRIVEIVEPFEKEKVIPIKALINGVNLQIKKPEQKIIEKLKPIEKEIPFNDENMKIEKLKEETINEKVSTVFISYSWDSEEHKKWVLDFADSLMKEGVYVILDQYEVKLGMNFKHFLETSINKANRILIIFTPDYKLKSERRESGVGYEYSIINAELYNNQANNERVIPILRKGSIKESIPEFMQQYIYANMVDGENYDKEYTNLLRQIYNEPEIVKPEIGIKRKMNKRH